jgi:hypothetical protein
MAEVTETSMTAGVPCLEEQIVALVTAQGRVRVSYLQGDLRSDLHEGRNPSEERVRRARRVLLEQGVTKEFKDTRLRENPKFIALAGPESARERVEYELDERRHQFARWEPGIGSVVDHVRLLEVVGDIVEAEIQRSGRG